MITLTQQDQQTAQTLKDLCANIEGSLKTSVNPNEPQELQNQIEVLRPYLSHISTMMSSASAIYDYAKGECAKEMMKSSQLLDLKANVQKMWIEGQLKDFSELYYRVESVTKSLDKSINGLVSLLSYEKEKMKNRIHQD